MRMLRVEIRHFRSLHKLDFEPTRASVICGTNSCGKSNVLRALKFAFLPSYNPDRMATNLCHLVVGGNAYASVRIKFDAPTAALAAAMQLPPGQPFLYQVRVKRNGKPSYKINGTAIDDSQRARFLEEVVVVHVPPIRDLTAGGLDPFKATLAAAIRKSRGANSLGQLNDRVRAAVKKSGKNILSGTQASAKSLLDVEELSVDTSGIELDGLLPLAGITFTVGGRESSLDKLGTGHQSSVILSLYRQLGSATGKFVLYLFEEPDNHLHPTSVRAVADELKDCLFEDSQAFITTHSPYFLNQFPVNDWLALSMDATRSTTLRLRKLARSDRDLRVALGKYGLRPAEALLSRRVVVVEGPNDVTLIRELVELQTGRSPDQQDLLIIPAGGKDAVSELCLLLDELGADWLGVFDWDATHDTRQPMLKSGIPQGDTPALLAALTLIDGHLRTDRGRQSRAKKAIDGLKGEVARATAIFKPDPPLHSVLGRHLTRAKTLTGAEATQLWKDVKQKRATSIRGALKKANLWLWSAAPEAVLLHSQDAEDTAERVLIQAGELAAPAQATNRRATLANALHGLGHKPEILRTVVRALHENQRLGGREWRELVRRLVP